MIKLGILWLAVVACVGCHSTDDYATKFSIYTRQVERLGPPIKKDIEPLPEGEFLRLSNELVAKADVPFLLTALSDFGHPYRQEAAVSILGEARPEVLFAHIGEVIEHGQPSAAIGCNFPCGHL